MPQYFTVSQLKSLVAAIPNSANAYELELPDGPLPIVRARASKADGSITYTVAYYLDPVAKTITPP